MNITAIHRRKLVNNCGVARGRSSATRMEAPTGVGSWKGVFLL